MTIATVVRTSIQALFHAVMLGSIYLLFAGHNQPGGGFVGGLVAASAVGLSYLTGGMDEVRGLSRFQPWTILGSGLLLAGLTAAAPLVTGGAVLESSYLSLDLPLLGPVKTTSALPFDIGVYLVVVGLVLMVFEAFGDDLESLDEDGNGNIDGNGGLEGDGASHDPADDPSEPLPPIVPTGGAQP